MMGRSHALSGAALYLAATPVHGHDGWALAAGSVAAMGGALLPDLDHPSGTAARAYGPVTWLLARVVEWVSGGHRHATHSLLGVAVMTLLAVAATLHTATAAVLLWLLAGLGVQGVAASRYDGPVAFVTAVAAAGAATSSAVLGVDMGVLPWAVGIGCAAHIIGDAATESGVPLLYPNRRRFRYASVDTGKDVERLFVTPALWLATGALTVWAFGLDLTTIGA